MNSVGPNCIQVRNMLWTYRLKKLLILLFDFGFVSTGIYSQEFNESNQLSRYEICWFNFFCTNFSKFVQWNDFTCFSVSSVFCMYFHFEILVEWCLSKFHKFENMSCHVEYNETNIVGYVSLIQLSVSVTLIA